VLLDPQPPHHHHPRQNPVLHRVHPRRRLPCPRPRPRRLPAIPPITLRLLQRPLRHNHCIIRNHNSILSFWVWVWDLSSLRSVNCSASAPHAAGVAASLRDAPLSSFNLQFTPQHYILLRYNVQHNYRL
jgi:hypothetical protein